MASVKVKDGIHWVGAVDYDVRDFHGYVTPRGTSYNAYLILDEKTALVDTVKKGFLADLLAHAGAHVDLSRLDYLVVNHVEMDHSGSVPDILARAPRAVIVCTQKGREGLERHYGIRDRTFKIVKTGDTLSLGKRTLAFVTAPMVHWPDSMFTYAAEDRVLLPNDGFGQHLASAHRFADEVGEELCMEEAAKYYANILMPLGSVIAKKLEEIARLKLVFDVIAPSHGAIWRRDPARIVNAYRDWTVFKALPKVTIVYDTMWGSTEKLARSLTEYLTGQGLDVKLHRIRTSDGSQIVRDVLDSRVVLIGAPTLNADLYWTVGGFLTYLRGLKPKNKKVGIFGSYGWAEGASRVIRRDIEAMGLDVLGEPFEVQYIPAAEDMKRLEEYGAAVAAAAKEG
ncbi:MAG: FprA family A-type flavoprotein [Deltaproteobacteria bacterium]